MIVGYEASYSEQKKIYNYVGCLYPEGVLDSKRSILFDHNNIETIFFEGYLDDEAKEFKEKLTKFMEIFPELSLPVQTEEVLEGLE